MESYYGYIVNAVLAIIVIVVCREMLRLPEPPKRIGEIALRDLYMLGEYSNKTSISVRYWVYSIEAYVYSVDPTKSVLDLCKKWNSNFNHDNEGYIDKGIEDAHSLFLEEIDSARREKRDVAFKVSAEYDYHNYPKSFMYNDFINPDKLLELVDNFIGGLS